MENEEIKLHEYGYTPDARVEIKGDLLMALMNFVNEVQQQENKPVFVFSRPTIKDNRDDQKKALKLTDVSIENVGFDNPAEFLQQEPQPAVTILGTKAIDLSYVLEDLHYSAIKNKIAVKLADLGKFKTDEFVGKA